MSVTASIQARLGSSRLPGKVLREICSKPLLQWQIERLRRSRLLDRIVVATTTNPVDDQIEAFCRELNVECYRGSEEDVLGRIAALAHDLNIDVHVECYGDSPLIDPQIVDEFIGYFLKYRGSCDYVSSAVRTTYPPGIEVTIYSGNVVQEVNTVVSPTDPLREHAGYNITRFPNIYRLASLEAPLWYRYPNVYLEVDTAEDFEVVRAVINHFISMGLEHFSLSQILDLVRVSPEVFKSNAAVKRRWKDLRLEQNA